MNEIMDMSFVQEPVEEVAAEPVRKPKKKKAAVEPEVTALAVAEEPKTNVREGVVVYANQHTGEIGVKADGVGYQMPNKFDCKVGDRVAFALIEGRPVLQ